jgi:hypothetical protein
MKDAMFCIELIDNMMRVPWWKRNKVWKKIEAGVLYSVVNPINKKSRGNGCKDGW